MTSSRINRSEGDNASEGNEGTGRLGVGVVDGITVAERVTKGGMCGAINCACSASAGVNVTSESEAIT
jgi:hypothetical protein